MKTIPAIETDRSGKERCGFLRVGKHNRNLTLRPDAVQYFLSRRPFSSILPETTAARAKLLAQSPQINHLRTLPAKALRSWMAERWYVSHEKGVVAFTTEYGTNHRKKYSTCLMIRDPLFQRKRISERQTTYAWVFVMIRWRVWEWVT
jgi:hypothetical protein